jgi:uncharacterized radical SAM superfamily Fe-S cluster-containing enzyme
VTRSMSRVLHETRALCPACNRVLEAALVERAGDAFLEMDCPEHGATSTLYFRNAAFYEALSACRNAVECCDTYDCARGEPCSRRATRTMIYMVNVTNNCNMSCDACLSGSEIGRGEPYETASRLMNALPDARGLGFTPHAVFFGGEPTMHPELREMIAGAVRRGYVPRLATNGLKLRERRYCESLSEAGLRWIFLHFDSLDDGRNRRLRGIPMVEACVEAVATAKAAGMKVQLGTTVSSENLDEVAALIRFAREQGVFWISLYPVAEVERHGSYGPTYLTDVVDALDRQTGGEITRADFVAAAKLWSRLFRLTGRYNYRQKPTMLSLPVVFDGQRLVPMNRLATPLGAARNAGAAWRFARSLPNLLDYESRPPSGDTLVLNIQQLQGRRAFDLSEAVHSLMSFADAGSFYPFDVYNHVHRWGEDLMPATTLSRRRGGPASSMA